LFSAAKELETGNRKHHLARKEACEIVEQLHRRGESQTECAISKEQSKLAELSSASPGGLTVRDDWEVISIDPECP